MRRSPFRISVLLLAVLAFVGASCAGGDGELGAPDIGGTLALKVGDFEYTNADLEVEIDAWSSNPLFLESGTGITDTGRPGARSMDVTTFVVGWRIFSEQARQVAAAAGYEPAPEELDSIRNAVAGSALDPSTGGSLLEAFDADFRDRFVEDLTYQQWAGSAIDATTVMPTVAVHSRYGDYDVSTGLTPPVGPILSSASFGF